ncbi:MAG: flagellar assembly protein FliW [Deltaproteobacteria bacterium]|nr:flagellar assembly protein FliW [Deltaproteobacteria bacterium]
MEFSTTRFGNIVVDESRIITMRGGILGFERLKRFVLLTQHDNIPFSWFQSVDDGSVAFIVTNAFMVKVDYSLVLSDSEVELLEIASVEDVVPMVIVTIRSEPFEITANLRAPVVINIARRLARQIVLQDSDYPVRFSIQTRTGQEEGGALI